MYYKLIFFRLFFGDNWPLNIVSIRMIKNKMNLETYIGAITALDCIISGNLFKDNTIYEHSKYRNIIKSLFLYKSDPELSSDNTMEFDPYIYQTFNSFICHKEQIVFEIENIRKYLKDKRLLQLLFYHSVKEKDDSMKRINSWIYNGN